MKDTLKTLLLAALLVAWTNEVFFVRPVQAGVVAPPVSEFTFTTTAKQKIHVNTWTNNGVQCSAITKDVDAPYDAPVALSCVKL